VNSGHKSARARVPARDDRIRALVDAGSFSAAADRLELTPSGVSKLISRLEEYLGVRLVQRTTRKMQLTEVGQSYLTSARRILEEIATNGAGDPERRSQAEGTLRVTAPSVLGHARVLRWCSPSSARIPSSWSISTSPIGSGSRRRGIDVAIRMTSAPPPSFIARKLDDDVRVLCASATTSSAAVLREPRTNLASHDCLLFTADQPGGTWRFRCAPKDDALTTQQVGGRLTVGKHPFTS